MYEVLLIMDGRDIKLRFELWSEAQSFIKSILNNCNEKIDISISKINNLDLKTIKSGDTARVSKSNEWSITDTDFND